jgi:hypothetical protein
VASGADKQVTVQDVKYDRSYTGPDKPYIGVLTKPAVIVDISVPLKAGIVSDRPGLTPEIETANQGG